MRPKSLLDLTNASIAPASLDRAALVIVDAQLEYVIGKLPLVGIGAAVREASALLELARRRCAHVVHVVQHSPPSRGVFDETGPLSAIVPELEPRAGEVVVQKRLPNAFAGTDLAERLRAAGKREIILAGFMTHMCISATARAALDLGFAATIVAAATATRDLPDPFGGVVSAADVQRVELAALADRFAAVVADCSALVGGAKP